MSKTRILGTVSYVRSKSGAITLAQPASVRVKSSLARECHGSDPASVSSRSPHLVPSVCPVTSEKCQYLGRASGIGPSCPLPPLPSSSLQDRRAWLERSLALPHSCRKWAKIASKTVSYRKVRGALYAACSKPRQTIRSGLFGESASARLVNQERSSAKGVEMGVSSWTLKFR